jgi:hypothetical protein
VLASIFSERYAYPVSPRWMNERGLSVSDLTWNADHNVAFVSSGERADQCCLSASTRADMTHHIRDGSDSESLVLLTRTT